MNEKHESSESIDELSLAILTACHSRGRVTETEIASMLQVATTDLPTASLESDGLIKSARSHFQLTQAGRQHLDTILEGIQEQLTPDAPEYERRYRFEDPSLPFAANTIWAEAICINVRVDPAALRPLIPDVFELDLYDGHAFVSITVSRLKNFGAGKIPKFVRMNFYQSTYRAHVTYTDFRGKTMRGCYFVRSETNSRIMSLTANLLPEFKAHQCSTYPILLARQNEHILLTVDSGGDQAGKIVLLLDVDHPLQDMPQSSVFPSVKEADGFIVDFHDAFSFEPRSREVYILRIERGEWNIRVCEPVDAYVGYVTDGPFPSGSAELDSVFYFQDCPYRWLPLIKERRKH